MRAYLVVGIVFLVLAGLIPPGSACHAATVHKAGVVVEDGQPRQAQLSLEKAACEGPVEVLVDVANGTGPETLEAHLDVTAPVGQDCLPWDPCAPRTPPAVVFELSTEDDTLALDGVAHNAGHTNEQITLEGTYRGDRAAFTVLKPV